ncbi:MAG: phage virion morphogenesis protein [Bacteroidetes bacterium]|nr:phage virion morphogenesis protein [Bacteroidota bacterium]
MFSQTIVKNLAGKKLQELAGKLGNLTPVMASISEDLLAYTEDNFRSEGKTLGKPWKELSKARIKQRGSAHPILQDQGILAKSIQNAHTSDTASVSTNMAYAAIHQFGGEIQVNRTITTRLRTKASGELMRQKSNANLAVFAKSSHKRFKESKTQTSYVMKMPERQYIGVNQENIRQMENNIKDWLIQ